MMRRLIMVNCACLLLWFGIGFKLGRETVPDACDQASAVPDFRVRQLACDPDRCVVQR